MLLMIALIAQAASPPAVTIQTRAVAPPPRVVTTPPRTMDDPAIFDVEVLADGKPLWRGQMRTTTDTSAAFTQTEMNAPPAPCPGTVNRYQASYRTALKVTLRMIATGDTAPFNMSVSWERPSAGRDCANLGTETTSHSENFDLAVGGRETVRGDGGLEVRLTRRR